MIVRDGEATLSRCLESVKDLVDDVVVMDTGSVDGTIDIARTFGARVFEMEWPDAFDAARNAALDEVRTPWVLVLDDDEWLVEGAAQGIRSLIESDESSGWFLVRQDLSSTGEFSEQSMLRLWRNHADVRFRGIIHEQIYPQDLERAFGSTVRTSDVRFRHDGYAIEATPEQELNEIRMIKKELETRPNQLYYLCMLACLEVKHDLPEGAVRLRRIIQSCLDRENDKHPPHAEVALPIAITLTRVPAAELNANRTRRLATLAWKWFSDSPIVMHGLAELELRRNHLQGLHTVLCRLAEMATSGAYSRHRSFDPAIFGAGLWGRLLETSKAVGRRDMMLVAAQNLLMVEPENAVATKIIESER